MSTIESHSSRSSSHYDSSRREKNNSSKRGGDTNHSNREGGYNSSTDPLVKSTHGERTSSNARHHPKAETTPTNVSNHTHSSKSHDRKRKSSNEDSDDVWTEHKSSSGRIYFYNKRLDKSQWEKPTKGTVKKLKQAPDPRMSSSTNKSSSTKSHSHTTSSQSHSHTSSSFHRDSTGSGSSSNHYHYDHHTPKRKISERKHSSSSSSSSTHSKVSKNISEAPISASSNDILSPTLPPPPPPPLPQNATPTHAPPPPDLSSPHLLPYMGVVNEAIGPTTPLQSYPGGWVTPGSTEGTPHPLQRTLMIQPQFSQGPHGSPRSLPTTPLQSFPPPTHLITTTNNNIQHSNHGYTTPLYSYDQPHPCSSKKLQLPMSRLGVWPPKDDAFPDPSLLKPLPQLQSNDFFSNALTLQWNSTIDGSALKQADSAQLESLSRTTVDVSYHCGQLVRNLLALECCRMKNVSRRTRITNLTHTIDQIEKR